MTRTRLTLLTFLLPFADRSRKHSTVDGFAPKCSTRGQRQFQARSFFEKGSGYKYRLLSLSSTKCMARKEDGDRSDTPQLNKFLTSASRERRNEERRRLERKEDVVIGKTSAKKGASDYDIDPEATRLQYMEQVSNKEREILLQTERGMEAMRMLRIKDADEAFERVYTLKPNAYLFGAGIAKFYMNDVSAAGNAFARNAQTYEGRFGMIASEERIWRDACYLKLYHSLSKRDRKQKISQYNVPGIPPFGEDENCAEFGMKQENRKVIRIARALFDASVRDDKASMVLLRAQLRAIGGDTGKKHGTIDPKQWKLNSWFYLGLHYDALGEEQESRDCMKKALLLSNGGCNSNDLIQNLPMIHMSQRDWFDDDEFDEEEPERNPRSKRNSNSREYSAFSKVEKEIDQVVQQMTIADIQRYFLQIKGRQVHGSKSDMKRSMIEDLTFDARQILRKSWQ